jgi:hypothetical protein
MPPLTPEPPFHRFGIRFTDDPSHSVSYLQGAHDEDPETAYRGELFLNEVRDELYYIDSSGVARRFGDRASVHFSRIDFSGLRDFDGDEAAGAADPPVPVGGMYRTDNFLKVRVV